MLRRSRFRPAGFNQPRPAALPRTPARENSRGHDQRPDQLDLRRLRAHQIIQRIPHSRSYQVTPEGLSIALFLTRVTQRFLIPGLAQLTSTAARLTAAPGRPRLQGRDHRPRPAGIHRR